MSNSVLCAITAHCTVMITTCDALAVMTSLHYTVIINIHEHLIITQQTAVKSFGPVLFQFAIDQKQFQIFISRRQIFLEIFQYILGVCEKFQIYDNNFSE